QEHERQRDSVGDKRAAQLRDRRVAAGAAGVAETSEVTAAEATEAAQPPEAPPPKPTNPPNPAEAAKPERRPGSGLEVDEPLAEDVLGALARHSRARRRLRGLDVQAGPRGGDGAAVDRFGRRGRVDGDVGRVPYGHAARGGRGPGRSARAAAGRAA